MRIVLLAFLFCTINLSAQENLQVLFGYDGAVSGTSYLPTIQKTDSNKVELNISYNFMVGNSSISYGSLRDIYTKQSLSKADVDNIISEMDDENKISLSQDFVVFGLGVKHMFLKKPLYWNFTISDRMSFNAYFDKDLPQLLWQGNEQFIGQTVDLSNTYLSGIYLRDFALGLNRNVFESNELKINAAFRLNYYQGIAGLSMEQNKITLTTAEGASSVELNYDLQYKEAGLSNFNLFETKGTGFGVDLGTSIEYNNKVSFHVGIIDWGSVTFSDNITTSSNSMHLKFDGLDNDAIENPIAFVDSLIAPEASLSTGKNGFTKNLGAKLTMMLSYKINRSTFLSSNKRIHAYYRQNVTVSDDGENNPMFALGFNNTMFHFINASFNTAWTSDRRLIFGALLGITFRRFDFSIYSNDFTGYVSPDGAKGAGFGFLLKANLF